MPQSIEMSTETQSLNIKKVFGMCTCRGNWFIHCRYFYSECNTIDTEKKQKKKTNWKKGKHCCYTALIWSVDDNYLNAASSLWVESVCVFWRKKQHVPCGIIIDWKGIIRIELNRFELYCMQEMHWSFLYTNLVFIHLFYVLC